MRKITQNDVDVVSIADKEKILHELNQDNLIELFKSSYKNPYKPVQPKKLSLDQQVSITISAEEKEFIRKELLEIRKVGTPISISAYIRNKAISIIDIEEWREQSLLGLNRLTSDEFNEQKLTKQKSKLLRLLDKVSDIREEDEDSKELVVTYSRQLKSIEERLNSIKKIKPRRGYRLAGRVTYNEANAIKWRAGRLSLTVADYIRFALFGYTPNTFADQHLSVDARKRFYISILDVAKNGWGDPPEVNECPNCARYLHDIQTLTEQLKRYQALERARRV